MADYHAYVFYVNRPDLLCRSIEAFGDLFYNLTVVDNSQNGVYKEVDWGDKLPEVFRPPVPLTYTQTMNWMLKDALKRKVDFIIHFHSDAFSTNPTAVKELLEYVRKLKSEGKKWGCAWTLYDILWACNPAALKEIGGWDTVFSAYFSDNDLTRRLTLSGWECINTNIQGVNHEGSATINSDEKLKFMNGVTFPLYSYYYQQKHGGETGHEVYSAPFNRPDLFAVKSK